MPRKREARTSLRSPGPCRSPCWKATKSLLAAFSTLDRSRRRRRRWRRRRTGTRRQNHRSIRARLRRRRRRWRRRRRRWRRWRRSRSAEIVDEACQQAVRAEPAVVDEGGGASRAIDLASTTRTRAGREEEITGRVVGTRAEEAILEANVDVAADWHVDAGDQLPREPAVGVAELLDTGIARAAAGIDDDASVAAKVDETVQHSRKDPG